MPLPPAGGFCSPAARTITTWNGGGVDEKILIATGVPCGYYQRKIDFSKIGAGMELKENRSSMDELIAKSKKKAKGLSREESAAYAANLKKLLEESGLNREVLSYVVGAVSICGLDSVAAWLEEQEIPCEQLKEFLRCKDFNENKSDIKAGTLFSLLKSVLCVKDVPPECTRILLTEISTACKSKSGRWLASIHKIFYNRFSNPLSLDTNLPPIDVLGLDQHTVAIIREMAEHIYAKMLEDDGIKPDGIKQSRVLEWLGKNHPQNSNCPILQTKKGESATNNGVRHPQQPDVSQKNTTAVTADPTSSVEAVSEAVAVPFHPRKTAKECATAHDLSILSLNERIVSMLAEIGEHAHELAEKNRKLIEENLQLKSNLIDKTRTLEALTQSRDALTQDVKERVGEIVRIKSEIQRLESEYAQFRNESADRLSRKEEDLERSGQLIREQDRQKNVFRNRLAKALRTDYQDFLEVVDSEMTIEMGNVMLAKVEGIFRILRENGINPGEHS